MTGTRSGGTRRWLSGDVCVRQTEAISGGSWRGGGASAERSDGTSVASRSPADGVASIPPPVQAAIRSTRGVVDGHDGGPSPGPHGTDIQQANLWSTRETGGAGALETGLGCDRLRQQHDDPRHLGPHGQTCGGSSARDGRGPSPRLEYTMIEPRASRAVSRRNGLREVNSVSSTQGPGGVLLRAMTHHNVGK